MIQGIRVASIARRVLFQPTLRNSDTFQGTCVAGICTKTDKLRNCTGTHNSENYDGDECHESPGK